MKIVIAHLRTGVCSNIVRFSDPLPMGSQAGNLSSSRDAYASKNGKRGFISNWTLIEFTSTSDPSFTTDESTFHLTFPLLNIECQSNFVLKTDCLKDKSFNKAWHRPDPPPLGNARILYFVLLFLFIPVYWKGFLKKLHLKQSFGCLTFCVASPAGLISNKLTFSLLAEKWDWRQLTICHSVGQPAKLLLL